MNTLDKKVEKFRDAIFSAPSRTYGEKFMEPLIRKYYKWEKPVGNENDALDEEGDSKEIKCSKVLRKVPPKKVKSLLDRVLLGDNTTIVDRIVPYDQSMIAEYFCNIQNVKRDHFKELVYILLFADHIMIFKIKSQDIQNVPRWSGKHGRYDEFGKSGQFGIDKSILDWHIHNTLVDTLTWDELYKIAEITTDDSKKHNRTK
jgi:hypothetical protein